MQKIQKGYYYHFKHNPKGPVNNYAYKVIGISKHIETEEMLVIYKPLYKNDWLGEAEVFARSIDMFMDNISKPEYSGPRFKLIENLEIISKLNDISNQSNK